MAFALVLLPAAALIVGGLAGGHEEIQVLLGRLGRGILSTASPS